RSQKPVLLGYYIRVGMAYASFLSPLAIRWEPSGQVVELFDSNRHSSAPHVSGSGPRQQWQCLKCPEGAEHSFVACFTYPDEPHERSFWHWDPWEENYGRFLLAAYCKERDAMEYVIDFECH